MKLTKRVLHNRAKPVGFDWPYQNQVLADQMLEFMRRENGIGLAAPQIGRSLRLFVMEVDGVNRCCFNPEILAVGPTSSQFAEGCLSFPGESCTITRPDSVAVRYQDAHGHWIETDLTGLEARCFQHELDHLDGITMLDRSTSKLNGQ